MDPLHSLRRAILLTFTGLPLLLIGFIFFLAIGLGNLGMFVLFAGHALAVPLSTAISQALFSRVFRGQPDRGTRPMSDLGQLVPSVPHLGLQQSVMPSWWNAHVLFFTGYIFANAYTIYSTPPDRGASDWQVQNRQTKAMAVMVVVLLFGLGISFLRYWTTGLETLTGWLWAILFSGGLGVAWYKIATLCGARPGDVFNIVQQVLPVSAKEEVPMTCVYAPKP
jgi:hypothetical protein